MPNQEPDFSGAGCALVFALVFGAVAFYWFSEMKSVPPGPGAGNGQGILMLKTGFIAFLALIMAFKFLFGDEEKK